MLTLLPRSALCGLTFVAVMAMTVPSATAQNILHFGELRIDVNNSVVSLSIYRADTGEPFVVDQVIEETGIYPDAEFYTTDDPGLSNLPPGVLVLKFTPVSCGSRPNCVALAQPITYAWSGNPEQTTPGSFYRPGPLGSGGVDTDFNLVNGTLNVHTADSGLSGDINTTLGNTGWTLPYDRTTLCAAVACSGGPSKQFFSAGVSTTAVYNGTWDYPQGLKLIPTFTFKGTVVPLTTWGTLTWNEPSLQLRFGADAWLELNAPLNAAGVTLTAANPTQGWGGVHFAAGSGGAWTGNTTVERVAGWDPLGAVGPEPYSAAVSVTNASPTFSNVLIQNAVGGQAIGLLVTGSSAAPVATELTVLNMTGNGVAVSGGARVDLVRGTFQGNAGVAVAASGPGTRAYLVPASGPDLFRGPLVTTNTSGGVSATSSAAVRFGQPSGPAGDGRARVFSNPGRGLLASGGSVMYAGTATGLYQRNEVYSNGGTGATGNGLATGSSSRVYAECNWWNTTTPSAFRVGQAASGIFSANSYLTGPPSTSPPCVDPGIGPLRTTPSGATGREIQAVAHRGDNGDATTPLDRLYEAMDAATTAEQVTQLSALATDEPATAEATAALGEVAVVASTAGVSATDRASALTVLATFTTHMVAPLRVAAWQGLVASRRASGDAQGALAAATALAAEGGNAALQAEVARVYLYSEAGNEAAALSALAALEVLAPSSVEADLARASLGLPSSVAAGRGIAATPDATTIDATSAKAVTASTPTLALAPNPASGASTLTLTLAEAADVTVTVYDLLGRAVQTVIQGTHTAGAHRASVDVASLAPGVYVVRATANTSGSMVVQTARLTVTR